MSIQTAAWIKGIEGCESPGFRKKINLHNIKNACIDICGLGLFELYVNGKKVGNSEYEPAASSYEDIFGANMKYPLPDSFLSPRVYYLNYDLTDYVVDGENVVSVILGNGFYKVYMDNIKEDKALIFPKLAFCIYVSDKNGNVKEINSDTTVLTFESQIVENDFYLGEKHDMRKLLDFHSIDFDDSKLSYATETDAPKAELSLYDFPKDKVIRTIAPKLIGTNKNMKIYDAGENISGRIKFDIKQGFSGNVNTAYAEEVNEDLSLFFNTSGWHDFPEGKFMKHEQRFTVICDGREHKNIHPHFSWQAFRYFSVEGEVENIVCEVIHTDIKKTAEFHCENEMINKILDAYIRTQLDNIHGCIPSDCPHRERLGYTGDGQITCETVMTIFDAKEMYKKWMQDIIDCSNKFNGHIQHTAPFYSAGGGPSGWGGAVIVLPYTFFKFYKDGELAAKYWNSMKCFIEYLESRCENGLVVREEDGGWCLGDWCYDNCSPFDKIPMTAEYVNTAYLVKFYDYMIELANKLNLEIDKDYYRKMEKVHKEAIVKNYYDKKTGDFCENVYAANAIAIDIGLGDSRAVSNLAQKYDKAGGLDTGIFATEIMMRVLIENGYTDVVYRLLTSEKEKASFGYMINQGATTLWEEWNGVHSHNHPMFGGCIKSLWTGFLGIRNTGLGFDNVLISPCDVKGLGNISGSIMTPNGKIAVDLNRENKKITIVIPKGTKGIFKFREIYEEFEHGIYEFKF